MKKLNNIIINVILFLIILFSFNNVYAKEYTISSNDYYFDYNTVLLDMDKAFSYLKNAYGLSNDDALINELSKLFLYKKHISGSCTKNNYAYRVSTSQKVSVSKKNQQIYVPDIYDICVKTRSPHIKIDAPVTIDDSVRVTIEIKNNKYYIPVYFLSSIPGVSVMVDNKAVYKSTNYLDVPKALSNNSTHTIKLVVNKITDYNSLAKDIGEYEYYGEEDGALWREEAKKRIEKNRRQNVIFSIQDKNGNPIDNASISVKQTDNTFKFGTAIANNSGVNNFNGITSTYFNGIGAENIFKPNYYYDHGATNTINYRKDLISKAKSLNIGYIRGHTLYWDKWEWSSTALNNSGIRGIIGREDDNNSNNITMGFVRNKYIEYNNDGYYTNTEKNQINAWIKQLKTKLKDYLFNYIKTTVTSHPEVNEWDLYNELTGTIYFRYYLYGEKFLTDSTFLKDRVKMSDNKGDEYLTHDEFVARFQKTDYSEYLDLLVEGIAYYRSITNKLLVINESKVNGIYSRGINSYPPEGKYDSSYNQAQWLNISSYQSEWLFEAINKKLKAKNMATIDAIGFETHIHERYYVTPNSYYNAYNKLLNNTGINRGRVTEFDICHYCDSGNMSKVSLIEKKLRAKYLSDFMIATYSNSKMDLFWTWVYTDNLTKEEQDSYKNTVKSWLNQNENLKTNNGKVNTRLNKGRYDVTVTYNNIKTTKTVNVTGTNTNNIDIKLNVMVKNILGDANNDGKITTIDYIMIRKHLLKTKLLTSEEIKRADIDQNGKISSLDYIAIRKKIISK